MPIPVLQPQTIVRFGIFELETRARELYRNGVRLRLAPQPLDLLLALLEQPGTVLTREVLQQRLWPPGTFVDYEHGLNKAVRKLREALGDSAEAPRYVETVQRTGYRFIAPVLPADPVAEAGPGASGLPESLPAGPTEDERETPAQPSLSGVTRRWRIRSVVALVSACVLAVAVWSLALRKEKTSARSLPAPAAHPVDRRAEEAYLHGRYLWFAGHPVAASDYFKRAIEIEPDYGAAWTGMSMFYGATLVAGHSDPAATLELERDAASRAVRYAPEMAEAHLAVCASLFLDTWQYEPAHTECLRATQLDPNDAEIYHFQSKMLAAVHREEEAVEVQEKASRLDSLSKPWALSLALLQARRYDEAFAEGRARLESFPHDPRLLNNLAWSSLFRGNAAEFADYFEQSYRFNGDEASATEVRDAFRSGGLHAVFRWRLDDLLKQGRTRYVSPFRLAVAYVDVGDREHALAELNTALQHHASDMLWIRAYPDFDVLASDARYRRILQALPAR